MPQVRVAEDAELGLGGGGSFEGDTQGGFGGRGPCLGAGRKRLDERREAVGEVNAGCPAPLTTARRRPLRHVEHGFERHEPLRTMRPRLEARRQLPPAKPRPHRRARDAALPLRLGKRHPLQRLVRRRFFELTPPCLDDLVRLERRSGIGHGVIVSIYPTIDTVSETVFDRVMFERFTDRARRVLVLAQEEARLLNHNYLGTEHILLGLVHEGEGVAALVLDSFGVGLDTVRQRIKEAVGDSPGAGVGAPPFTPRSKKVLELSLREALRLGHNYIGTEHLLLGLVRVDEGLAAQILTQLGVPSTDAVRDRVTTVLREHGQTPTTPGFTPAGATVRDRARMLASAEGSGDARVPAGSHHYLLALLADATSLASGVLVGLGVTEDAVRQKIAELGTAGTSDEVTTMPTPITVEIAPGVSISADDPKQLEGVDLDELRRRITGTPP